MSAPIIPDVSDELPVGLRAFAGPLWTEPKKPRTEKKRRKPAPASPWTIVFDTETLPEPGQPLRFGTYQVRKSGELRDAGIFYHPEGVNDAELAILSEYASANGLTMLNRDQFADDIFFAIGWRFRARIVGFNLPFDIARIALHHGTARSREFGADMHDAFTFRLSDQKIYPYVQIKHRSQRMAFIRFAATMKQPDGRSTRKRRETRGHRAGHFIDVKTLAGAQFAKSFSLRKLGETLGIANPKLDIDDYAGPVTEDMARYAVRDVQATWECLESLLVRHEALDLPGLVPEKVFSEASIGKSHLSHMGIVPWQTVQPDFPRQIMANIMGSYSGGRSEVRIRREMRQVMLCDFLSMYPTVCTLMKLWDFVTAQGITFCDSTEETRGFLDHIDAAALQASDQWQRFTTLVRVLPQGDVFPVRAPYAQHSDTLTIGSNYLSADQPLWFTLADCIAAKLLTGKPPHVIEAMTFSPAPQQTGLSPVEIGGNPEYRVDPATDDFFKRVIELRQATKNRRDVTSGAEREALDVEQNQLKIAVNATSYGALIEVNVSTRPRHIKTVVHSSTAAPFSFSTDMLEQPGRFFHPLLATLITGAARLMLALTERLVTDRGLDWAFCDTDSMAIAKPDDMDSTIFADHVRKIVGWFEPLNPYGFSGSILKIEDENRSLETGEHRPLYVWAISAKRYALFNLDADRRPIIRKVTAHGLGHLLPPYSENDAPVGFPTPHRSALGKGIRRWHIDLWHHVVAAALSGHPDRVALDYHPGLLKPAISRYAATSPTLLRWFKPYNEGKSYRSQVKPFGFLLALSAKADFGGERLVRKGRTTKVTSVKPIAPFDTDIDTVTRTAFDRETGKPTYTYNVNGQIATAADAKNNLTTYIYDDLRRLSQTEYPSPTTPGTSNTSDYEQLGYDPNGNVTSQRLRDGNNVGFTYDALNRITARTSPHITSGSDPSLSYGYDLLGNLTGANDENSDFTSYGIDALGRIVSAASAHGGTKTMTYDLAGNRTKITWQDGFYVTFSYDNIGEMTAVQEQNGTGNLVAFAYDDLGDRTSKAYANGTSTTYGYDPVSRLTSLSIAGSTYPDTITLGNYNPAGQIGTRTQSNDAFAYTYATVGSTSYTSNGLNQYSSIGGTAHSYDGRGNMTGGYGLSTYTYNSRNEAISATTVFGGESVYYNPLGRLDSIHSSSTWTDYDDRNPISELNQSNGSIARRYVFGPGSNEPLVWYEGSGTTDKRFMDADERGSIIRITDATAAAKYQNVYDEFGNEWFSNGGRFAFAGQLSSGGMGIADAQARAYSSYYGRFMQTDPIGFADGMNWYNYAHGDPINSLDPSGLATCPDGTVSDNCADHQGITVSHPEFSNFGGFGYFNLGVLPFIDPGTAALLSLPQNPTCARALSTAGKTPAAVQRANNNMATLTQAATANGIDPSLLAAVGVRESGFQNIPEAGGGHGMGVFQLTNRPGVTSAQAYNIPFAANYAAGMLSSNMSALSSAFPSLTSTQLTQATAASYNFGLSNISGNPNTIDSGTTNNNYGSNVVGLMSCFPH